MTATQENPIIYLVLPPLLQPQQHPKETTSNIMVTSQNAVTLTVYPS
jgi:hypothetical protein